MYNKYIIKNVQYLLKYLSSITISNINNCIIILLTYCLRLLISDYILNTYEYLYKMQHTHTVTAVHIIVITDFQLLFFFSI